MADGDAGSIKIRVNERDEVVSKGMTLKEARLRFRRDADVVIYNGHPLSGDITLSSGDTIALIRRGEVPTPGEMEAFLVARHGPGVHEKTRAAHVGIAGLGGLGSTVAIALARTGVGRLRLVDYDVVEPSNLNRQEYFVDQIGEPKTEALSRTIERINPFVKVEAVSKELRRETVCEVLDGCDIVAECFDGAEMKRDLVAAFRAARSGTPVVSVSGLAGYGPAEDITVRRAFGNIWIIGDERSEARPGRGLLAPRVAVAAGHQANLVLRLILGEETLARPTEDSAP